MGRHIMVKPLRNSNAFISVLGAYFVENLKKRLLVLK